MNTNSPTHEEISRRARELWQAQGKPVGKDHEIWLEAERQLAKPATAESAKPAAGASAKPVTAANAPSATGGRGNGNSQATKTPAVDPKAGAKSQPGKSASPAAGKPKDAPAQAERLRGEMASESEVEFQITPAVPDDQAIKAALQKQEARSPQRAAKPAPRVKPPETGKPLWSKPHSS